MLRRVLCILAALALCAVFPAFAETETAEPESPGTLGLELTVFSEEDLHFSGLFYPELQPDSLPGIPEKILIDNEDGTFWLRCLEESWEALFSCDEQGENASILSFTFLDSTMEGPRGIRLGDEFYQGFQKFRSGENEMTEDLTEVLYGTEDSVPRGLANYYPGCMTLHYVTDTAAGIQVELVLQYENTTLTDMVIRTLE